MPLTNYLDLLNRINKYICKFVITNKSQLRIRIRPTFTLRRGDGVRRRGGAREGLAGTVPCHTLGANTKCKQIFIATLLF